MAFLLNVYGVNLVIIQKAFNYDEMKPKQPKPLKEILLEANEEERNGNLDTAIALYERALQAAVPQELVYNRLMVLYRKLHRYKDESRIIDRGIKDFEKLYEAKLPKKADQKLMRLSNVFLKTAGLVNKKGESMYLPEPIGKWMKRKKVVQKKLNDS